MEIADRRADFPILNRRVHDQPLVYLDNAATTHKPQAVMDRLAAYYGHENSSIHRAAHAMAMDAGAAYEKARASVQSFLGAGSRSEIVFTAGATESINLVAASFGEAFVGEGDQIVVSAMEHHSNLVPWQRLCRRVGAGLRVIPVADDGILNIDSLERILNENTRLLALTHVSNVTGIVNPVAEAIAIAHSHEVPVLIDGAQAVPHMSVDVVELDCDFYVFSGHKVYAEAGIGVLYGKSHLLQAMPPYQSGGGMITSVGLEESRFEEPPLRFEAGTRNVAAALSLQTALEYVTGSGMERIEAHEGALLGRLERGLRAMDGVTIHGAGSGRRGSLSFNLDGVHPADAGMVLDKLGIAIRAGTHCAEPYVRQLAPEGTIRVSVALYNTQEDIDALLGGMERVDELLRAKRSRGWR